MTGTLTRFEDALALIEREVVPLGSERVALAEASGRVLAEPLDARFDAPRQPISAMDGYAVILADVEPGKNLRVVGESCAGTPYAGTIAPGETARIFTGAVLPAGADCVVMQEYAIREGERVTFAPGYGPGCHVRPAGSDFAAGERLLPAGTRLTPRAMIAAAAADRDALSVALRPRVAIIGTGDEIADPGTAHQRADAIPDTVTFGIAALANDFGARIVARALGADHLPTLERLAGAMLQQADVVIVTGGASVGERDFAKPMFAVHGLELLFAKLAIKPGKPVWLGRAQGRWVIGLPGNPTAAMVTARLFLVPLLARLQGEALDEVMHWRRLPLAAPIAAPGQRETFLRARWQNKGLWPLANQDSGAQAVLARADWLIRCPPDSGPLAQSELVEALAF
jgi:molybdopterin molybdotransferase